MTTIDALQAAAANDPVAAGVLHDYRMETDAEYAAAAELAAKLGACGWHQESAVIERHFGWPAGTCGLDQRRPQRAWNVSLDEQCRRLIAWASEHEDRHAKAIARLRSEAARPQAAKLERMDRRRARMISEDARRGRAIRQRIADITPGTAITAEPSGRRLKVRAVSVAGAAETARTKALESGRWQAICRDGGSVCNSYGYHAETEGVLAVSDPRGRVVVFFTRLPANKVTRGGVAGTCCAVARPLFDERFGAAAKAAAWAELKQLHRYLAVGSKWEG